MRLPHIPWSRIKVPREAGVYAALILVFVFSRGMYFLAGVRFDSTTIFYFMQLLDPVLLESRLLESLWYLHAQPPVFNAITGLALKLAPVHFDRLLWLLFMAVGCATMLMLFATMRHIGIRTNWAAVAAIGFTCTPAFVIYENWYFYPHLALAVLVAIAFALSRSAGEPSRWMGVAFWLCAVLVGLRSVYHPLYAGLALGTVAVIAGRKQWGAVTRRAALPLVLIGALVLKNLILFGLLGTTSWGGNNLNRVAAAGVDPAELEELAAMGVTTPLTLGLQFPRGDIIVDALDLEPQVTGIPALDRTTKTPLNEYTTINPLNYNHWAYTAAATTYAWDAWILIRRYPRAYLRTVRANVRMFHRPVSLDSFVRANRNSVARLAQVSERVAARVNLVVGLAVLFGAVSMLRRDLPKRERLLLAYLVGTVAWTTLLGVTFEVGENNRFRYHLTGLHLLLVAYLLSKSAKYVKRTWRSRGAVSSGRGPQELDSKSEVMGAGWG